MAAWWNWRFGGNANGVTKIQPSRRQGPVFEKLEERIMLSAAAVWSNVPIGGGGFVTGIVYNQSTPNLVYARTDVGGAYRWNAANSTWTPITDSINAPGVLSIATDATNPNRVYIAAGLYTAWWASDASIFYSTNQGASWTQVSLPFKLGGNEDGRGAGERLQIDPNNDSILYLGTNDNGLWKSTNYGQSWSQVTSFSPTSVTFVVFNKASGSAGNATPNIYVGVNTTSGPNLYESTDAGNSWAPVANEPTNGMLAYRAEMDSSGNMYISYDDALGPNDVAAGAVWKLDTFNGAWTNITPPTGQGGFAGVAVDAENPGTILVSTLDRWWPGPQGDQIYRSTNGGATWTDVFSSATFNSPSSPYRNNAVVSWLADVEIDPFNSNNAMFTTGGGLYACANVTNANTGGSTTWSFTDSGLEEMVPLGLIAPSTGSPLLSTMGDIGGFNFTNFTSSPAAGAFSPNMGTNTSIDFAQNNASDMVRVGYGAPYGTYSTNGGTSWTAFPSVPPGASSSGPGAIAISANGNTIVWTPNNSGTYYSTNMGSNWYTSSGAPVSSSNSFTPIADRSNSNYFYIYDQLNGTVYVSSNGGASFAAGASGLPTYGSGLKAAPGYAGDVWLEAGTGGLYRSTNYGSSFSQDTSVQTAYAVAFGKSLAGGYPAIYLWGEVNNVTGLFVSNDTGGTWTQIDTSAEPFGWSGAPQGINAMAASPNVYGEVFVGGGGRGLFVGNIATPLPSGWSDQDIGAPADSGSAGYSGGNWTVSGGGADIWGTSDQFNFASQSWYGSGTLTAQVTSVQNTDSWAKAGVMFRDSNSASSMFVDVMATPGNGVTMQWRNATGGQSGYTAISGINAPVWVQLIRNGNNFSGYYSTNGSTWNLIATTTVAFTNSSNLAGLAVTAHNNAALNTSTFSNVSLVSTLLTAANTTDTNIGSPALNGSSSYNAQYGDWSVSGGGADIWGASDQFNFASTNWTGDGILSARVTSLQNTNSWAKAGVMMRNSTAANSPFVDVVATAGHGVAMQWRTDSGQLGNIQISGLATPVWVRLIRTGNSFSGYYSSDGSTWTQIGSVSITFSNTSILAGMAVTSHNTGALSIATFSDVTLWS